MYLKADKSIWTGRSDEEEGPEGKRWHEVIQTIDLTNPDFHRLKEGHHGVVLLGFKCDEGVRRNKGRTGAAGGPESIRRILANLPVHFKKGAVLLDGGDISCENGDLETAQEELAELVTVVIRRGYFPLVLGGGHETAWGTFQGLAAVEKAGSKTGIINLDAHFDLRKPAEEGGSSGTPFYQMAEWHRSHGHVFKYLVIGIQQMSNTRALFERAHQPGTEYVTSGDIRNNPEKVHEKLAAFIHSIDHIYFTVCLDVFNSAFAPGVSAPNPLGIHPFDATGVIRVIKDSKKIIAADIAEMNPAFDADRHTARLAASVVFELLSDQQ